MLRPSLVSRVALALLVAATLLGCKSGAGERCQVNDDCEGNLVCNRSTSTCDNDPGTSDAGGSDAAIDADETDAADGDAMPIDAPTDAPIDAPVDAPIDAP